MSRSSGGAVYQAWDDDVQAADGCWGGVDGGCSVGLPSSDSQGFSQQRWVGLVLGLKMLSSGRVEKLTTQEGCHAKYDFPVAGWGENNLGSFPRMDMLRLHWSPDPNCILPPVGQLYLGGG
ncbi:hypothetical protein DSO57_1011004 [Entomophthora muscae]|uniref:Uncharacterized protein n=1 Tax=Entomophthora muscae TaxID=34485 RepID=A0ACC2RL27_9FUNG|nr:hypothetical protein DSO57_1011004 [Entomophthora muscae]